MDAVKYLERINYRGPAPATLAVLQQLQAAHLRHVPFENLDIHLGRPIELGKSYEKVVQARRGGFCYEFNGLFFELLRGLGYSVKLISARVATKDGGFGPEYDHMAIVATVAGVDYLVDVGFGDFSLQPLQLGRPGVLPDGWGDFVIELHEAPYQVVKKRVGDAFEPQYIFTEMARKLEEFADMCRYHQTSPDSHFTQKRLCSLPLPQGRVTITGNRLLIKEPAGATERPLGSEEEFRQALRTHFGVEL